MHTKTVKLPDVAAALYKFEYRVLRKCADRALSSYSNAEMLDGTFTSDMKDRFKLTQSVVKSESSFAMRKTGSGSNWKTPWPWERQKFYKNDGPSLVVDYPTDPHYGSRAVTYAGDAMRLSVAFNKGFEYKVTVTWIVTAKDRENSWEGKHRITMVMSDSNPTGVQFTPEILVAPKEVK